MLKKRIITASILAPLVVLAVFKLSSMQFAYLWAAIILLAAWEWTYLIGMKSWVMRVLYLPLLLLPMAAILYFPQILQILADLFGKPGIMQQSGLIEWLMIGPLLWWFMVMMLIRKSSDGLLALKLGVGSKALIGWFVLLAGWMFLSRLRILEEPAMTMYFLLLIWSADIAAYFIGKKFGKVQLAPEISPGKTVEGLYGALLAAAVSSICFSVYYNFITMSISDFLLLSLITVMVSIYGDLFFSLIKRQRGVKDSGALLPGHGGLLDRLDSVIAAVPVFYAGVWFIRWMAS